MKHDEVQNLLGAYALDAVEPDERIAVEEHLDACPRCRDEVTSHLEVAAALANVGGDAPAGLWDRIASSLEEPPPALDLARVRTAAAAARGGKRAIAGLSTRLAAAAAVVLVLVGALSLKVVQQDRRINEMVVALGEDGFERELAAAAVDPEARKVRLSSPEDDVVAQAVLRTDGRGYLLASALPKLPAELTYQLWAVYGERKVSLGVLGRDPGAVAFQVDTAPVALAVTAEQEGGVEQPTRNPVVLGFLDA